MIKSRDKLSKKLKKSESKNTVANRLLWNPDVQLSRKYSDIVLQLWKSGQLEHGIYNPKPRKI